MTAYKIKEIAEICGVSSEMIRYYEKKGVVNPQRAASNGYRSFSIFDIYTLLETQQYQAYGMKIADIVETLLDENSLDHTRAAMQQARESYSRQIREMELKSQRLEQRMGYLESLVMNLQNHWVKTVPDYYLYFLSDGRGDQYKSGQNQQEELKAVMREPYIGFMDCFVLFHPDTQEWYFAMEDKWHQALAPVPRATRYLEGCTCLCTIADMGDLGAFSGDCARELTEYALHHEYQVAGCVRGILHFRGMGKNGYHRFLELQLPVKKKSGI